MLGKIHGILNMAVSKWVRNEAHILAFHFVSRNLGFLFLTAVKDTVPPNKACLYGSINLNLTQVQQQPLSGLPLSSGSIQGGKAKSGFWCSVQK